MNCRVFYPNGDEELLDLSGDDYIFRISKDSHIGRIASKILTGKDNGIMIISTGFDERNHRHSPTGTWKQCGGGPYTNTAWTNGIFNTTDKPTRHQFEDKVVMSYVRTARAQFFSAEEQIGVLRANYWLTSNKSLPVLLNSKAVRLFYSLFRPNDKGMAPVILKAINFEGLTAQTELEVYQHYGLTEEEINWLKNYNRNEI
jgi:hypothetical protein